MALFTPPHLLDGYRWRGMRVGLLGGSFNPPHRGHLHISTVALKYLQLDCIWWMVTPQNPLKTETGGYEKRLAQCRALVQKHPRIIISDLERDTKTNRTVETIRILKNHFPQTEFAFLGGSDLLPQMHRWYRWQILSDLVPLAFVARPPACKLIQNSRFRMQKNENRFLDQGEKATLSPGKIYWIMGEKLHGESSTCLRNSNKNR